MALWLIFLLFATISLSEGTVLGDIERGTASWLVAMPIGRPTVIAAKASASAVGVSAAVYIVGGLLYPLFDAASKEGITRFRVDELTEVTASPIGKWGVYVSLPEPGQYFAMLSAIALLAVFLVAVMIALGTMIRSRTAVFGIGLACFAALIVGWAVARDAMAVSPVGLITSITEGLQTKAVELAVPATGTVALSFALVALAIWRFRRRELS
jgi:ABC-type transport system involved in multi-copper enzyme maturation permease subunit